jgi:hypothetical protein
MTDYIIYYISTLPTLFERFQKAYRAYGFRIEVCFLSLYQIR